MPASLVTSQLDTLEPLGSDESGSALDLSHPVDDIVDEFITTLTHPEEA
jgi:gluconokinase